MSDKTKSPAQEHLDWCVDRAMEYANRGDWVNAWASFASDVRKHEGTEWIFGNPLLGMAMLSGAYDRPAAFRDFNHRVERLMTTFIESPADYLGETVTVTEYQPRHQQIGLGGKPARKPSTPEAYAYAPRHQWQVRRHRQAPWGAR